MWPLLILKYSILIKKSSPFKPLYTPKRKITRLLRKNASDGLLPPEEVADEMLSILSERDRLVKKHISQSAQQKINEFYNREEE